MKRRVFFRFSETRGKELTRNLHVHCSLMLAGVPRAPRGVGSLEGAVLSPEVCPARTLGSGVTLCLSLQPVPAPCESQAGSRRSEHMDKDSLLNTGESRPLLWQMEASFRGGKGDFSQGGGWNYAGWPRFSTWLCTHSYRLKPQGWGWDWRDTLPRAERLPRRTSESSVSLTRVLFLSSPHWIHRKVTKSTHVYIIFIFQDKGSYTASFSKCTETQQAQTYFCLHVKIKSNSFCSYKSTYLYFRVMAWPRISN